MKYIIMSRNALEGFQKGHFQGLELFLESHVENSTIWCRSLSDAQKFSSEDEAVGFARGIWGFQFANSEMLIVAISDTALEGAARSNEKINAQPYSIRRIPNHA